MAIPMINNCFIKYWLQRKCIASKRQCIFYRYCKKNIMWASFWYLICYINNIKKN